MKKICFASSGGGHLDELNQLTNVVLKYDIFYVIPYSKVSSENEKMRKYFIKDIKREFHISFFCGIIQNLLKSWWILKRERPDVVISTGALAALPICLICKMYNTKLIFIESLAKKNSPSKTGKLVYKFADKFIIQWEELKKFYPNAIYGGWIY